MKVVAAAGLDYRYIGVHDKILGPGQLFDLGASRAMVEMTVADEEDLDIAEVKAESLDAVPDQRRRRFEIAVDEDVALGCGNQVGGEIFAADVIQIAGNAKRGEGSRPGGIVRRFESHRKHQKQQK